MSNKRSRRRGGQRVRSEATRKTARSTKSRDAFMAALPIERAQRERDRHWKNPTKREIRERAQRVYRWKFAGKPRKIRKRRTSLKRWPPRHDLDN